MRRAAGALALFAFAAMGLLAVAPRISPLYVASVDGRPRLVRCGGGGGAPRVCLFGSHAIMSVEAELDGGRLRSLWEGDLEPRTCELRSGGRVAPLDRRTCCLALEDTGFPCVAERGE